MNVNEIAFIICADQAQYYNECVRYIKELEIPKQYQIDIICIQEASSMLEGYCAGMQASNAKYKVYLRQDVFILNRNFIFDILKIFRRDGNIGLIGMIGCSSLPKDADCDQCWDVGCMEVFDGRTLIDEFVLRQPKKEYEEVQAVQGTIMITQYDIEWSESLLNSLDGWDFYDIALSLEMSRNNYKIVVPRQKIPWCYHIKDWPDLKHYEKYRLKIIQEYPDLFEEKDVEKEKEILQKMEQTEEVNAIRNEMVQAIENGRFQLMKEAADDIRLIWPLDVQMREIANIMEIYILEEASNASNSHSEWFGFCDWNQIFEYYTWIRFILIRIAYQREDERIEELKRKVLEGKISYDAIYKISRISLRSMQWIDSYFFKRKREEPLVSVIVPVYNGQDTIGRTIESILNQTYHNIELIIIDDASTDQSRNIISEYMDERIKVFYLEKNQNVCYAGNIGFENAKGKYVALIGHDDLWKADKLCKQISFLEEHTDYSVCFTWIDIIDDENRQSNDKYIDLYRKMCSDNFSQIQWIHKLLKKGNHMCAPSACIRHEVLEKIGYYRYGLLQMQDYDLWLRLLAEGPVYFLQEKLTYYRRYRDDGIKENLSSGSPGKWNRIWHEKQYIAYRYFMEMGEEIFKKLYHAFMKAPDAQGKKEILCEKAFILWDMENCYAATLFINLLEDEEIRKILSVKYHFELSDFYERNKKPLSFDPGYSVTEL